MKIASRKTGSVSLLEAKIREWFKNSFTTYYETGLGR